DGTTVSPKRSRRRREQLRAYSRSLSQGREVWCACVVTRRRNVRLFTLAAVLLPIVAVGPTAIASDQPPLPSNDSFYRYTGSRPLADIAAGTVLKRRSIQVAFGTTSTPIAAEQLLYRTTDQLGKPSVTVTTVIEPVLAAVQPRIVGYLSFY